jgi:glycosyltransferase involved in cell wall biosynthesis
MLRVLTYTTLFPNAEQPVLGVFVENRLRQVAATGRVDLTVVAPVPWFPFKSKRFGLYGTYARVPDREVRHGIEIFHPRYPVIPKIGMRVTPSLLYRATRRLVARLAEQRGVQMIDAHYFYPDGVAAARIATDLGLPLVVTARGTDLNLIPRWAGPRRRIAQAAARADAIVTVCDALQQPLLDMGVESKKIRTLRNGVDIEVFAPRDRDAARAKFGVEGRLLVSVGGLVERKGHHLTIEAMASLPGEVSLFIAGDGPERGALERQVESLGLSGRVRLLGRVPHEELAELYSAADASVLASSREGWANVLLESMACGTPVAATGIWGTAEVVAAPEAGLLIPERTAPAVAATVRRLLDALPDRAATRAYAERFTWDETTRGQLELFGRLVNGAAG